MGRATSSYGARSRGPSSGPRGSVVTPFLPLQSARMENRWDCEITNDSFLTGCSQAINHQTFLPLVRGSAEGDVLVVDAGRFSVRQTVKEAHMVFTTAADFSPDSK